MTQSPHAAFLESIPDPILRNPRRLLGYCEARGVRPSLYDLSVERARRGFVTLPRAWRTSARPEPLPLLNSWEVADLVEHCRNVDRRLRSAA